MPSDSSTWEIQIIPSGGTLCDWITAQGGINNLTTDNVLTIFECLWPLTEPPTSPEGYTFIPTEANLYGVLDYYLGYNGDGLTGCSFYGGV
jgi:hypothetical protein